MRFARNLRGYALALAVVFAFANLSFAQQRQQSERPPTPEQEKERQHQEELAAYIKANYTKYEYLVPMRDGKRLFTSVYVPKDRSQTYPILFDRTPYSVAPYGPDNYRTSMGPSEQLMKSGYIFAYQDVRGKFMSEGEFVEMRPYIANKRGPQDFDESSDAYDTIDWLVKNIPNNNGKVGMWGISYPGFYTSMGMIDAHPALKAVSPQAPIADWFIGDDFHHNGVLFLPHMSLFEAVFGLPRPEPTTKWPERLDPPTTDGYNFFMTMEPLSNINASWYKHRVKFWDEVTQHPNYDQYWQARSTLKYLKNIKPATLVVGGWFDAEDLFGEINTYQRTNTDSPQGDVKLIMGPWCHGCWARSKGDHLGYVWFGSNTSEYYREKLELPFFEQYLKGKGTANLPEATMFETGTNEWRQYDQWPPKQAKAESLYLHANGKLSFTAPAANEGYDEYISDPAKPVPFYSENVQGMQREYMLDDQRHAGRRPDVLVYQTDVLDHDVTLVGPVKPSLIVSTSGSDSDFAVKLIDVYPSDTQDNPKNPEHVKLADFQQLVRGEPFRGRFRNSFEKPEAFVPNQQTKLEFVMPDVNHTFRRGHRIMVQIQSTWFPLGDINPQKFVPNIYDAKASDFQKATQRVYHVPNAASRIEVLTLQK